MKKYMPPSDPHIEHVVINTLAKQELKKRRGISSTVLPDIFDFNQPAWKKDDFNRDFLKQFGIKENDLVILQATRVIPRKGIEISSTIKNLADNLLWKSLPEKKMIFMIGGGTVTLFTM